MSSDTEVEVSNGSESHEGESSGVDEAAIVARASAGGWVPKERYKKDPATWVDAATFVERGKRFTATLASEVQDLRKQVKEFEGTREAFKKYSEERLNAKQAELDAAIRDLKMQRVRATREGDDEGVLAIEDRIDVLSKEKSGLTDDAAKAKDAAKPAEVGSVPPEVAQKLQTWIDNGNQWFEKDSKLRVYAIEVATDLRKAQPNISQEDLLAEVRNVMEIEFPHKFSKPSSPVSGGAGTGTKRGGRGYADLPQADKDLCDQFAREGWVTKEKFVKDYWERQG